MNALTNQGGDGVARVYEMVQEIRRERDQLRVRVAELEAERDALAGDVGARVHELLQAALTECDEIRRRAHEEAVDMLSRARHVVLDLDRGAEVGRDHR